MRKLIATMVLLMGVLWFGPVADATQVICEYTYNGCVTTTTEYVTTTTVDECDQDQCPEETTTTTLPSTTTTAGTFCPGPVCGGGFQDTTTTTAAPTTTVAPTTAAPTTTAPAPTTAASLIPPVQDEQPVAPAEPSQSLPVTGGAGWLAIFGFCLFVLGILAIAFAYTPKRSRS